ncbi:hypothetical protein NC652_025494 [Populus alba x Populus x berolinensis]|nr:hypothetical protein NC652_025494 [Populus alba x Populus x berolinensis]
MINLFCVGNKDVDTEPVAQQDWRNGVVQSCLRAVLTNKVKPPWDLLISDKIGLVCPDLSGSF